MAMAGFFSASAVGIPQNLQYILTPNGAGKNFVMKPIGGVLSEPFFRMPLAYVGAVRIKPRRG